ncbi:PilZ domain-containing protein [Dissulfurirhabdus thermomarina]|uniref:PilZ domain-containing protein n=1 Tax=Dissulfurirhabdus thermomarina TaxID=1765737 RepID=A0A6N9TSY3_DISTH|nr:PilZ domain-containing protein [Dissulfurirhabdus thermomarina]NDY42557.1 PilZ domain-containing protein [Dissulfurirhabdus thermomarina]NMX23684.1 PilZ domain-containing protein [Dissulfurirhabdus thermomarina]
MKAERRSAARVPGTVTVTLQLRRGENGAPVAGPVGARITDFARKGAGLEAAQVRLGTYHVFYSPQDDPSLVLHLELAEGPGDDDNFALPVQVLWMDRNDEDDDFPFRLGVAFLLPKDDPRILRLEKLVLAP